MTINKIKNNLTFYLLSALFITAIPQYSQANAKKCLIGASIVCVGIIVAYLIVKGDPKGHGHSSCSGKGCTNH